MKSDLLYYEHKYLLIPSFILLSWVNPYAGGG